jgi:hypothetical protein
VLSDRFVTDVERPARGVAAEFGLGYAYVKDFRPGLLAWGPGQFDAAFQTIDFRLMDDGEIHTRMVFVANRPSQIVRVPLDPRALLDPDSQASSRLNVDPVLAYVKTLNTLTGGAASRRWCVNLDQLCLVFLAKHFEQHFKAIAGVLYAWRQIPDWLDCRALPAWVMSGSGPSR